MARADVTRSEGEQLLPSQFVLALPAYTRNQSIIDASWRFLTLLPVFTNTRYLGFNYAVWYLRPRCFDEYRNVRHIAFRGAYSRCSPDVKAFSAAIKSRGNAIFPSLARITITRSDFKDQRHLFDLVKALRLHPSVTEKLEQVVLPARYDTEGTAVFDEMRALLGPDRVKVGRNDSYEYNFSLTGMIHELNCQDCG